MDTELIGRMFRMAKKKSLRPAAKTNKTSKPKSKGGGSKLSRSEVIQVRIDPKLRFAAEIAARKHRRTLSSFVEWAVSEGVRQVTVGFKEGDTAEFVASKAWDIDEADRFVKLATKFPHLLTHDEEVLWKLVCEKQQYWLLSGDVKTKLRLEKNPEKIDLRPLRNVFEDFKEYMDGKKSAEVQSNFDGFLEIQTINFESRLKER
jgi:hypothetical protein